MICRNLLERETMKNSTFSRAATASCALALVSVGLAGCSSVDDVAVAQLKTVRTVPVDGRAPANPQASAAVAIKVPTSPALAKTGRVAAPAAAISTAQAAPQVPPTPAGLGEVASALPLQAGVAGVDYFIIPGRVAVPQPRPDYKSVAVVDPAKLTPQQRLDLLAAANVTQANMDTAKAAATNMVAAAPAAEASVDVAALATPTPQNEPQTFVVPGRVTIPLDKPANELAYASPTKANALEAIAAQAPGTKQTETAILTSLEQKAVMDAQKKPRSPFDDLIFKYATLYGVPESFVHRVAKRESTYNPKAFHKGNYGMMQIRYNTAKGLGYKGKPEGLFDPETNLKYAVKYLRGAWMVADGNEDKADKLYMSGYYYHAKQKGLLEATFLK
jgi:soluble lytic murein transglycosylase-like protein